MKNSSSDRNGCLSREKRDILLVWKVVKRDILFSSGLNSFNFYLLGASSIGFLFKKCMSRFERLFFMYSLGGGSVSE